MANLQSVKLERDTFFFFKAEETERAIKIL